MKVRIRSLFFSLMLCLVASSTVQGQWSQTADNYTTARLSIGTTAFNDKLNIEGTGEWQVRLRDNLAGQDWRIGSSGSGWAAGAGKFLISNNAASTSASLVIDAQRRVGIGTYNPQAFLDVGAFIQNETLGTVLGRLPEGNTTGTGTYLGIRGYATQQDVYNGKSFSFEHAFYGTVNSSINFYRGGGITGGFLTFNTDNNIEQMRIGSNGNVGIGTTTTGSFKLAVEGKIGAREINVLTGPGWPDYVFEKNYNLLPLAEVEGYINQNKHLPGVPAAKEMEKNGVNLGEMNMLLLKKVEELTLYVLEQHKTNQIQSDEIKLLKQQLRTLELK